MGVLFWNGFDFKEFWAAAGESAAQRIRVLGELTELSAEFPICFQARQRSIGVNEVPVVQHRSLLKAIHFRWQIRNFAVIAEEVLEERPLHSILVDEEQKFIQLRAVDHTAVILKN